MAIQHKHHNYLCDSDLGSPPLGLDHDQMPEIEDRLKEIAKRKVLIDQQRAIDAAEKSRADAVEAERQEAAKRSGATLAYRLSEKS
jgi:hypothetical protein